MKKLVMLFSVLLCSSVLSSCVRKEKTDSLEETKRKYPYVMVDTRPGGGVDEDGDSVFFVYRCQNCQGVQSELEKQRDRLWQINTDIETILFSKRIDEKNRKQLIQLKKEHQETFRFVTKMQYAKRKFLEDEDNRLNN